MCIRDRDHASDTDEEIESIAEEDLADEIAQPRRPRARRYNCLLYTSDAADERSSVDLGGRRIIKKKKRNNIKGRTSVTLKQRKKAMN